MECSPVACLRQSNLCFRSDSVGSLPRNFPLSRAMAMTSRVRMRMRSVSNSAKVARILRNIFSIGSPGVESPPEGQFQASFRKLTGDGARIRDVPGQPVEFGHYQRVVFAHGGEGLLETGTGHAGEAVIGVDVIPGDAQLQERLMLGGQILPVGGAAPVSDKSCRHGEKCTDGVPPPQLFPYHATMLQVLADSLRRPLDLTDNVAPASMSGQRRACEYERTTAKWNIPSRSIWSGRHHAGLFDLPTYETSPLRHCTLSDDIEHIRVRHGRHSRLGFPLRLCAFRFESLSGLVDDENKVPYKSHWASSWSCVSRFLSSLSALLTRT